MKYKVTTDNLDWIYTKRGDILTERNNIMFNIRTGNDPLGREEFKYIYNLHPDWFEEIVPEYTEEDLFSFSTFCDMARHSPPCDIIQAWKDSKLTNG